MGAAEDARRAGMHEDPRRARFLGERARGDQPHAFENFLHQNLTTTFSITILYHWLLTFLSITSGFPPTIEALNRGARYGPVVRLNRYRDPFRIKGSPKKFC